MAKKPATAETVNRSQLIREYADANPKAKPADIAKALSADGGVQISAALVGQVLAARNKKPKVAVETIKAAASFVKNYKGKTEEAEKAIREVGDFVTTCGNVENAIAALTTFREVSQAIS